MKKRLLTFWIIACMLVSLVGQTPLVAIAEGNDAQLLSMPENQTIPNEVLSNLPLNLPAQEDTTSVETPETQQEEESTVENPVNLTTEDGESSAITENSENTVSEVPATQTIQSDNTDSKPIECIEQILEASLPQGTHQNGDIVRVSGVLPKDAIVEAIPVDVEIEGQIVLLAYDITIYANEDNKNAGISWQPEEGGLNVEFISSALESSEEEVNIWHMEDTEQDPEYVTAAPSSADSVEFVAESFSVYVVTETKLTATIAASDGNTYEVNVTYDNKSGIPMEGTALKVDELNPGDDGYEEYIEESAAKVGAKAEDLGFSKVFDIKIVDENDETIEYEPTGNVDVSIRVIGVSLSDYENVNVIHFVEDKNDQNMLVINVESTVTEETVVFTTNSFSVYALVADFNPSLINVKVLDLEELTEVNETTGNCNYADPDGFYLFYGGDKFFTNTLNGNSAFVEGSIDSASLWFFESTGTVNQYYIYTYDNSVKKYMRSTGGNNMGLTENVSQATPFEFSYAESSKFYIKKVGENRWLQHSGSGNGIRLYTDKNNATNSQISFMYASTVGSVMTDDYCGLDGKSYGLLSYSGQTTAYAMMDTPDNNKLKASEEMYVRNDPMQQSQILFVAKNSDISFWTFESIELDKYYLTSNGKYLKIESGGVSLVDTPDEYCRIQIEVDAKRRIRLIGVESSKEITYKDKSFQIATLGSGTKFNLAEESVYSTYDFISRSAYKVSVSDLTNVPSGKEVIIYTRVWDYTNTQYEFFAIDHNGDLVPCYESGDTITWIGAQNNTLLWRITDLPNQYFQLQNTYSEKYITPQIAGSVFTTDENAVNNRVNLGGRQHGDYYTTILRWDDPHYDYASIRTENGSIASGRMSQAEQFYFAIMDPLIPGVLTEVETVDHSQLGMTMKMVNYGGSIKTAQGSNVSPTTQVQYDVIGSQYYGTGNTEPKLLSTDIGDDGYPTAKNTGRSLKDLFTAGQNVEVKDDVNHLFIQSIYDSSGYFQYDSTQNFAHLNNDGTFSVYQELGTVSGNSATRKHGQFMPYNTIKPGTPRSGNSQNLTDILANNLDESDPRKYETLYGFNEADDYYFGMEISGSFMQTPNGLDAWGHDLIFDFVGDDDFWMYVDDELVIDLGGIHSALEATVNYSTGEVIVNKNNTTLYDLFKTNYAERNGLSENDPAVTDYLDGIFREKVVNGQTRHVFKDYSTHTVRIFYMERGAGASNLRLRFNLATVEQGQVLLSKEVTSNDTEVKDEFISKTYPFQIFYRTTGTTEYSTWGSTPGQPESVVIKNTAIPIEYTGTYSAGGYDYKDVFLLRPGQIAAINFPDNLNDYFIRECAIDPNVYDEVKVNGEVISSSNPASISGAQGSGITSTPGGTDQNYRYYQISSAQVKDRAEVVFSNNVIPSQLHTLTITKKLFDENGNELSREDDGTGFLVRIYLGKEGTDYKYYDTGEYYVKDESGNYCKFVSGSGFTSLGKTDFGTLTDSEKTEATFRTSPSGAADKIPAGYSIEIRDLLEDTYFKVVEEDYDIPIGYGKRSWYGSEVVNGSTNNKYYVCYRRVDGTYTYFEERKENEGKIDAQDAVMEVHNVRGYGILVNKVWSDADFISEHAKVYVAVYIGDNVDPIPGSIHTIDRYNSTRYFFLTLEPGANFEDYHVYEVDVENPVTGDYDYVTSYTSITKRAGGSSFELEGNKLKHNGGIITRNYTVTYTQGTPENSNGANVANIRTDTVTNSASGGLTVLKRDMNGNALQGGQFELRSSSNNLIDTYTADSEGLITILYLDNGTYTLTETKTPAGYHVLTTAITIVADNGVYTVEDGIAAGYDYDDTDSVLTIKNKPYTLEAIKIKAGNSNERLKDAHFALYKQIIVNGNERKDYYPMSGYEDLVTDVNGVIPNINENLSPGSYYLVETETPPGYSTLAKDVLITINPTNPSNPVIAIDNLHNDLNWLTSEEDSNHTTHYSLKIPNPPDDVEIVVAPTNYVTNYKPFFMMFGFGALLVGLIAGPVAMLKRRREEEE